MRDVLDESLEVGALRETSDSQKCREKREGEAGEGRTAITPSPFGANNVLSKSETSSLLLAPRSSSSANPRRTPRFAEAVEKRQTHLFGRTLPFCSTFALPKSRQYDCLGRPPAGIVFAVLGVAAERDLDGRGGRESSSSSVWIRWTAGGGVSMSGTR